MTDFFISGNEIEKISFPGEINTTFTFAAAGTAGNDFIIEDLGNAVTHSGSTGDDLIIGGSLADTLSGGDGNDHLLGGTGDDLLTGDAGDDQLTGDAGNDILQGGAGQDLYLFDGRSTGGETDTITDTSGTDFIEILPKAELVEASRSGDNLHLTLSDSNIVVVDHFNGKAVEGIELEFDVPDNRDDDEFFILRSDTTGDITPDLIAGTSADDVFDGGSLDDWLFGATGNDTLAGNTGDDTLSGGSGDDTLSGGTGNDTADFRSSATTVTVDLGAGTASGDGADVLSSIENAIGSEFGDTITGDANDNRLFGAGGGDTLSGGTGNDDLFGGNDIDTLVGDAGSDTLFGGAGNDVLTGGAAEADVFAYAEISDGEAVASNLAVFAGGDSISDFSSGDGDKIQISASAFGITSITSTVNFFSMTGYDGTNSGATAGVKHLVFDTGANALIYDDDSSTAGYTILGSTSAAVADTDIQIDFSSQFS